MPSGYGGIMRYSEEYRSKLQISPKGVIAFLIAIVVFVFVLKLVFPVA